MRIRSRWLEPVAAWGAVILFRLLFLTIRKRLIFVEPSTNPYIPPGEQTYTYCVWHDSLLAPLFIGRQPATMALVGGHRDGTFLANAMDALGIGSARGSTSAGGTAAVRFLVKEGARHHLVLTPDGPRGPRREMKTGCAFLAAKTGKGVVPTAFRYRSFWSIGTGWTNLEIPMPFTTVYAFTGPVMQIPESASREELDEWTARIQAEMDRLDAEAIEMAKKR
ncbi:MAG: DUF374 domain-containing protein [Planctomycetaceae bacterium]|nr:DUF374 domain-containing protein [Planctomycetaceae bacterium]